MNILERRNLDCFGPMREDVIVTQVSWMFSVISRIITPQKGLKVKVSVAWNAPCKVNSCKVIQNVNTKARVKMLFMLLEETKLEW